MSFKTDMRRFAADLRAAEASGMKHWSKDVWVGFLDGKYPMFSFEQRDCGCLFGGALRDQLQTSDFPLSIERRYPSFGYYYTDDSPAHLISDASESGVDFAVMADFIDGTPDWALDEYESGTKTEDES